MRNSRPWPRPCTLPICSEQRLSRSPGGTTSSPGSAVATATSSEPQPVEQRVGQPDCRDAPGEEPQRGVPRGVGVDQQHATAELHHRRREVDRRRALADAPLRIGHRDASHEHPPSPPRGSTPLPAPNRGPTRCYRSGHGPSLSRFLGLQGPWVPSCLGTQPPRSQESTETCWIGTDFPTFHVHSIHRFLGPCSIGTEVPIRQGTISASPRSSTWYTWFPETMGPCLIGSQDTLRSCVSRHGSLDSMADRDALVPGLSATHVPLLASDQGLLATSSDQVALGEHRVPSSATTTRIPRLLPVQGPGGTEAPTPTSWRSWSFISSTDLAPWPDRLPRQLGHLHVIDDPGPLP